MAERRATDLAQFKATFVNRFVSAEGITSVIELGCGDGAQLALAEHPLYIGADISGAALEFTDAIRR